MIGDWVYHILGRKHGEHSSQQTMFHLKDSQKPNGSDTSFGRMEAVSIQNRSASESVVVPVCGKDSLFPCENPELSLVERRLWQIHDMVETHLSKNNPLNQTVWRSFDSKDTISTPITRCFQITSLNATCKKRWSGGPLWAFRLVNVLHNIFWTHVEAWHRLEHPVQYWICSFRGPWLGYLGERHFQWFIKKKLENQHYAVYRRTCSFTCKTCAFASSKPRKEMFI